MYKVILTIFLALAALVASATNVVGIRADNSTDLFPLNNIRSIKASADNKLIVNKTNGDRYSGYETLKFEGADNSLADVDAVSIRVYPNPVRSVLYIVGADETTEITVVDINGKIVKWGRGASISVEDLAKGKYILLVEGKKVKFIKE